MAPAWEFQSIPIDFDVFKQLTSRLESPNDTYNGVLRRLLGLPATDHQASRPESGSGGWTIDGVTFPEGTRFRARYKGNYHYGTVRSGALEYEGKRYTSPSPAAFAVTGTSINGWRFWECQKPGDFNWTFMDGLRRK